ncbi:hypothetical protein PLICRDRAFT_52072 [Plicaturopsis crispa FD-325 SS-3]|nr:hypothetical protein PLICRDRAFT_52072 [Plicaturopsis crispa FD-325 SS-3]
MPTVVYTPDAVPPLPIYSQAVISKGLVFLSGNIGFAPDQKTVIEGGVQAQTRSALDNLGKILVASGSGFEHVTKVNIYLTNLARDFAPMNEVYAQYFNKDALPARTCIGVAALPLGAEVEIECVAEVVA